MGPGGRSEISFKPPVKCNGTRSFVYTIYLLGINHRPITILIITSIKKVINCGNPFLFYRNSVYLPPSPRKPRTPFQSSALTPPLHDLPLLLLAINTTSLPQRLDQNRHRSITKISRAAHFIQVVGELGRYLLEVVAVEVVIFRRGFGLRGVLIVC